MEVDKPIERLASERDSFERLIVPELAGVYRLAGYLLCDAAAAEDAAQEAILRLPQRVRRLGGYRHL